MNSQDSQYQCGQPLLQLGIVAAMPMTSPRTKNQSTCRLARLGAKRAQSQAQRIETSTNNAVLVKRATSVGTRPLTKSPGKRRESRGVGRNDKHHRQHVAAKNDDDGFKHRLIPPCLDQHPQHNGSTLYHALGQCLVNQMGCRRPVSGGMRYAPNCSTCSRHKEKETGNAED